MADFMFQRLTTADKSLGNVLRSCGQS